MYYHELKEAIEKYVKSRYENGDNENSICEEIKLAAWKIIRDEFDAEIAARYFS